MAQYFIHICCPVRIGSEYWTPLLLPKVQNSVANPTESDYMRIFDIFWTLKVILIRCDNTNVVPSEWAVNIEHPWCKVQNSVAIPTRLVLWFAFKDKHLMKDSDRKFYKFLKFAVVVSGLWWSSSLIAGQPWGPLNQNVFIMPMLFM